MEKYILALDQGTTSCRTVIINSKGRIIASAQKEFTQYFPQPGRVEHDPNEIWSSQAATIAEAISKIGINGKQIAGIGITNQRETTIVWDKNTGKPLYNAIVWQDRRTANYCDKLKANGCENIVNEKTGLVIDAYFSATKLKWILDNVEGAREKAEKGELAFGTPDTWLVWKLTAGKKHITDVSNASRTMLFNIKTKKWDKELLDLFDIPEAILPEVIPSSGILAYTQTPILAHSVPIAGILGDQQAALFGQLCTEPGMVKNTYGTGCFILMNTGDKIIKSENKLISTIAWELDGNLSYALEGSVFVAGSAVQWLRDMLNVINTAAESEILANQVEDNGGVYFVPAFTGLGAPHWTQHSRGVMAGITRGTKKGHIVRATLEGIAFQVADVLKAMEADSEIEIKELLTDGGAAANNILLQFQADILRKPVIRAEQLESTALGAAYMAGLAVDYWHNKEELYKHRKINKHFEAQISKSETERHLSNWSKALELSKYLKFE